MGFPQFGRRRRFYPFFLSMGFEGDIALPRSRTLETFQAIDLAFFFFFRSSFTGEM